MDIQDIVSRWQEKATDPVIAAQLAELVASGDEAALEDAFYRNLEFGTAGLRGVLGPGTNRMNVYTVRQATQGLAEYVNSLPGEGKSVAISYDSRINSDLFSKTAAEVLAGNGIVAYIYPRLEPTPALSFATRYLHCDAGINVTASHNPSQYNGYKAYGPDGCQIASEAADAIQATIQHVDCFDGVRMMAFEEGIEAGLIKLIDDSVLEAFLDAVEAESVCAPGDETEKLDLVYTPLNGTGLECVSKILKRIGIEEIHVVPEQADPDGNFPTCLYPNPEERAALERGIAMCEKLHPDLLLATDPDADRVGIAVENEGDYVLPTGNEVGVLLLDYICRVKSAQGIMPKQPVAVTTIVSTDMVDAVAAKYGVEVRRVLTGFKYIGGVIAELEEQGREDDFVFGFEESYGYLSGTKVRDKDAVNASMLICQMARYYRKRGKNLVEALQDLYAEFGHYCNKTISVAFEGIAGAAAMKEIMANLRAQAPAKIAGLAVEGVIDYQEGYAGLPKANVLELGLAGGQKVIFRPSGTEPKIKAYTFANGSDAAGAQDLCERISAAARDLLQA